LLPFCAKEFKASFFGLSDTSGTETIFWSQTLAITGSTQFQEALIQAEPRLGIGSCVQESALKVY
jgi:hypothetical protein